MRLILLREFPRNKFTQNVVEVIFLIKKLIYSKNILGFSMKSCYFALQYIVFLVSDSTNR